MTRMSLRWIVPLCASLLCGAAWAHAEDAVEATDSDSSHAAKEPAAKAEKDAAKDDGWKNGFSFGTYGRVQISGDTTGRPGEPMNVVAHGPRLAEGPYAELDFKYNIKTDDGFKVKVITTVAFMDEFFHFNGNAEQNIAIRNFYAEASGFLPTDLKLWIGSRMYRGDDIYLLDFWPLDNLNTLGAGLSWNYKGFELKAHVGANRLKDDYQYRDIDVPASYGSQKITVVDRQRVISSLKATYYAFDIAPALSMKFSLYGEYHYMPSGKFQFSDTNADYLSQYGLSFKAGDVARFKSDKGAVIGAQVGLWNFAPNSHLNLTARYATGLAAYGEWSVPWGVASDGTATGAKEMVLASSFNWESHWVGVMAGGYLRLFKDASANKYDNEDYMEGIFAVRPAIFITRHFHQLFEISHQWKDPFGLGTIYPNYDGTTTETSGYPTVKHMTPQIWQLSVIEALSMDRGMYQRPQFRLVYTASHLNADARAQYSSYDVRAGKTWQHYIGAQVEWWLDSESYK